jgi:hypothetical protein
MRVFLRAFQSVLTESARAAAMPLRSACRESRITALFLASAGDIPANAGPGDFGVRYGYRLSTFDFRLSSECRCGLLQAAFSRGAVAWRFKQAGSIAIEVASAKKTTGFGSGLRSSCCSSGLARSQVKRALTGAFARSTASGR